MTDNPVTPRPQSHNKADASDPQNLVERAIQSVLGQIPELPDEPLEDPALKLQPWAEKSGPTGKNKRSMETLIEEFAARLATHPHEMVHLPEPPHTTTFYDRFAARASRKRSRRRRPGEGAGGQRTQQGGLQGQPGQAPRSQGQASGQGSGEGQRPPGSRNSRRRRPRRGPRPE